MHDHYKRVVIFCSLLGVYSVGSAIFLPVSDVQLWVSIIVIAVIGMYIRLPKDELKKMKVLRGQIFKVEPKLALILLSLIILMPIAIGYLVYSQFEFNWNQACFMAMGMSYFGNVLSQTIMLPRYRDALNRTFD